MASNVSHSTLLPVNLTSTPPPKYGSLNQDANHTAEKVNKWIRAGHWFLIGAAIGFTSSVGVILYGFALKVSLVTVAKYFRNCLITAISFMIVGEGLIKYGGGWKFDPTPYLPKIDLSSMGTPFVSGQPLQNQLPGLRNEGNTCFINGSLQPLLALTPYRKALLETAEKESAYHAAWMKLYNAIFSKDEPNLIEWSDSEIKGILICLARHPKVGLTPQEITEELKASITEDNQIDLSACLTRGGWMESPFSRAVQGFVTAQEQDQPWPECTNLSASLHDFIQFLRRDSVSQKYLQKAQSSLSLSQKAFDALMQGIQSYQQREQALQGDISQVTMDHVAPPYDIHLRYLREFMSLGGSHRSGQEDAEEFITSLFGRLRRCEHPNLFFNPIELKHMVPFETDDEELKNQIANERAKSDRTDVIPDHGIIREHLHSPLIRLTCPIREGKSGQDLVDEWASSPTKLEEAEKVKNLYFFANGNYYIEHEEHRFEHLPDHLILQVKRFDYDRAAKQRNKIDVKIPFSEIVKVQDQSYRVIGVTLHSGTATSGHYTALVRDKTGSGWWCCNDECVTKASESKVMDGLASGYLYYLEKIQDS